MNITRRTHAGPVLTGISIAIVLTLGACKENSITYVSGSSASNPNLIDPSIKPVVLYTYPANRAVGPFPTLFAPGTNRYNPFFYVQFNKSMIANSYYPPCYWCIGFAYPVRIETQVSEPSTILYFNIYRGYSYNPGRYEIGKLYTFTLDSSLQDVNGNRLANPYSFAFTPEPFFRVISTRPGNGEVFQSPDSYLEMEFNSVVDSTVLSHVHITPNVEGRWTRRYDSLGMTFYPSAYYTPSTDYTIQVDQGARDIYNHAPNAPFISRVSTKAVQVISADVLPYSNYMTNAAMAAFISIRLTYPVDTQSVRSAITITPPLPLTFVGGSNAQFYATNDFAPATDYHVTVSTDLRSVDGTHLSSPYSFSFKTEPFRLILATFDVYGRIEMFFSGRVVMSSLQSAFSISPQLSGTFTRDDNPATQQNGPEYWFTPSPPLQRGTMYTVRLDASLTSIGGYQLAQPDTFQIGF